MSGTGAGTSPAAALAQQAHRRLQAGALAPRRHLPRPSPALPLRQHPRGAGTKAGEAAPLHSVGFKRLIDKLRMFPQAGKHTIVETVPWKEYKIGILPGQRGGVIEITEEAYPTREDAEHAIFLMRLRVFLDAYGINN